jgi:hypothetical protein
MLWWRESYESQMTDPMGRSLLFLSDVSWGAQIAMTNEGQSHVIYCLSCARIGSRYDEQVKNDVPDVLRQLRTYLPQTRAGWLLLCLLLLLGLIGILGMGDCLLNHGGTGTGDFCDYFVAG